jgi:hypothetical protein
MSKAPIEPQEYLYGVKVVQIEDLRVARGLTRRPFSSCRHKSLTYDDKERRIWCRDCETEVEAFDAFVGLVEVFSAGKAQLDRVVMNLPRPRNSRSSAGLRRQSIRLGEARRWRHFALTVIPQFFRKTLLVAWPWHQRALLSQRASEPPRPASDQLAPPETRPLRRVFCFQGLAIVRGLFISAG